MDWIDQLLNYICLGVRGSQVGILSCTNTEFGLDLLLKKMSLIKEDSNQFSNMIQCLEY